MAFGNVGGFTVMVWQLMTSAKSSVVVHPALSVTLNVIVPLAVAVGVPLNTPPVASVKPAGNVPLCTVKV